MISGSTTAGALCVYPMRAASSGQISLLEEPKCFSVSDGPAEIGFKSKDANYLLIVDYNYASQMTSCLSSPSPCPTHSEGFVQ